MIEGLSVVEVTCPAIRTRNVRNVFRLHPGTNNETFGQSDEQGRNEE